MWNPRIEIERPIDDLSKELWVFGVIDNMVVLNAYSLLVRASRRHKFKAQKAYDRYSNRYDKIKEDEVPTPEDVFDEALAQARSQLVVGLWHRDFKR